MQKENSIQPLFLNLDSSYESMDKTESPFMKGVGWDFNANGELPTGTGNGSGEGQNEVALTPTRSNEKFPIPALPAGKNKNIGSYTCELTHELYYFNHNSNSNHGIYVIDTEAFVAYKVLVDPQLQFSDNPEAFMANHRVTMRLVKNAEGVVVEKILIITDGQSWQKWVLVRTAIETDGFNTGLYPYWSLQPPHFDRRELFEYAVRPPMINPKVEAIPNTDADKGIINRMVDAAFQFCFQFIYTDGRETTVSPYSLPYFLAREVFLSNSDLIPKKVNLTLYAGSCMVEKINIFYRMTKKEDNEAGNRFLPWGIWYLYDTIYKYDNGLTNTNAVLETKYWLRQNPWAQYNYDAVFNTIKYVFDNSKLGQIIGQDLFNRVENNISQLSVGLSDIGDSVLLANNRDGYDNLSTKVTDKLSVEIREADDIACPIPTRTVKMYAYIGNAEEDASYISQVGYYNGEDTQMRFGGMRFDPDADQIIVSVSESKSFRLDFADREAFRLYFKGTQYFADGEWAIVNTDNTITPLTDLLDFSTIDAKTLVQNVFKSGGYFICTFEAELPAGRYIATLGRHNVSSTEDYINTSTYISGIYNSRVKSFDSETGLVSIKNNARVTVSKEMEIDCTAGDVDTWGNNRDLFYVYCPHISRGGIARYRFVEGYIKESPDRIIGFELIPYNLTGNNGADDYGVVTDKNGFYFGYTKAANSADRDMGFTFRRNCTYPQIFIIYSSNGLGWKENGVSYWSTYNNNTVGFGNYVVLNARVTDLTGTIGYSNIAISIVDGQTVYTDADGNAQLIIHNGQQVPRQSNVYINAGGDFLISVLNCGFLPINQYNEYNIPCQTSTERVYPFPINQAVKIATGEIRSLKSEATYIVDIVCADLAGRVGACNRIAVKGVPSFLQRNNVSATYFQWILNGALQLNQDIRTSDFAWLAFYVSKSIDYRKYLQWVGDKIEFIDSNGQVTTNASGAVFVRITIDSLLDANVRQNFTLFANYQFVNGDRLRVFDDGEGQLFDVATFGDMIDVDIAGTNYNQAAISANLLPPLTNTVIPQDQTVGPNPTTLYVKYDSKFDKLKDKTGFWIELYTPSQNTEKLPFYEADGFYPIINGEIAEYTGGGVSNPQYNYPTTAKINFWDTYLLRRSISILNAGNKFFNHPFESPNITDTWGANVISGGRQNLENPEAKQLWYEDTTIRSDVYISNGAKNGLGTFRSENRKDFKGYERGGIVGIISAYNYLMFICENGWFVVDYNYQYIYANAQGVQIANLDKNMGEPHQKIKDNYGCAYHDTGTIFSYDGVVGWHDAKNTGYIISDYSSAVDITDQKDGERRIGIKSYYSKKCQFIGEWNKTHDKSSRWDVQVGVDTNVNKLFITFRPRRQNTNDIRSYVNHRRNVQVENQETFVFSLDKKRWLPMDIFCPEAYGSVRSFRMGNNMFSFVNGEPWYHTPLGAATFSRAYEELVQPVVVGVINDDLENDKVFMSVGEDSNNSVLWCDLIYSNDNNAYSYIPANFFIKKNTMFYAPVLGNMNTYPTLDKSQSFRSFLMDGKRVFGRYFIVRWLLKFDKIGQYFEINKLYYKYKTTGNNQK